MRDYRRFDAFLDGISGDVYAEPPMEPHLTITRDMVASLYRGGYLRAGDRILDIGCGQGLALERFRDLSLQAVGITLGPDVEICRAKGLAVLEMDQNFLEFGDAEFDFLWCRHVLEHSIAPRFTLTEYRRVTKPGGLAYVEVPAPDTTAHHEANPNHYSVLPKSAWLSLFPQAGYAVESSLEHNFEVNSGPDTYWGFLLRRQD